MRLCGVIAEYNPFHNGHAHQLAEARRRSGCDYLIVCMDGGMTQRGDAALLDKGTRARMALLHGADLVIELPALFAVRPADWFARGGVLTLGALGVDALSFGCETDDLELLTRLKTAFHGNDPQIEQAVRDRLSAGQSHARARGDSADWHGRGVYQLENRLPSGAGKGHRHTDNRADSENLLRGKKSPREYSYSYDKRNQARARAVLDGLTAQTGETLWHRRKFPQRRTSKLQSFASAAA